MRRSVTLIVKATRLCNLRCSYCNDWSAEKNQKMPFPVMAKVMAAALGDPTHVHVNVIWHGGEPTIMGIPFFEKAMALQSRLRREGQTLDNSIQTNATLLTPEWARFFARYQVGVGVSIDGPPAIHNKTRIYMNGRPSWPQVRRGLQLLYDYGVKASVLMVVDREALSMGPGRICDFFLAEGIKKFGFLAAKPANQPNASPTTPTEHYVAPPEMMQFLIGVYDYLESHCDPEVEVRELDMLTKRILGINDRPCTLVGGCVGNFFIVEPNGSIAHCDLFLGDANYHLGNITKKCFAEIRKSRTLAAIEVKNAAEVDAMTRCQEFHVCNGWCPHERYTSVRHNPNHDPTCCGLRPLIDHIRSRITRRGALTLATTPESPLVPMYQQPVKNMK